MISKPMPRLGMGSFAFRYAVGFGGFQPSRPMTPLDFLSEAHRLGFEGVQLCENMDFAEYPESELLAIRERAEALGLFVELGMRPLTLENVLRHVEIAERLSSQFLRVVLGDNRPHPEDNPNVLRTRAVRILREVLPYCKERNLTIGIENHFDLPPGELVRIVEEIGDERVGLILDTTNSLGFLERPEETLETFRPYLLSIHLKDYAISKVEAGYRISGTVLGEGWLHVGEVLTSALESNPTLSIIMEMTIRREDHWSLEETLAWEKKAVEKSARCLQETLSFYHTV